MPAQLSSFTSLSFPCISEEAIEDAEGPGEASADPEELAKDQGSGGEEGQSKRAGTVHGHPQPLDLLPGRNETGAREPKSVQTYHRAYHRGSFVVLCLFARLLLLLLFVWFGFCLVLFCSFETGSHHISLAALKCAV